VKEIPSLSVEEYRRLCEFLYRRTGMTFSEDKRYYVERRVIERMTAKNVESFAVYFSGLRSDFESEIEHLINALTVNETYFYREDHQFKCMTNDLLAERVRLKKPGAHVRIWSVPCSTGEEPYSIAIWLLDNWSLVDSYDIEIVGSDIDTRALLAAQEGEYGRRALMHLTPAQVATYFHETTPERWRIIDDLRQSVRFTPVNIVDPLETRAHGKFDIIFCRNVLIYFNETSRRVAAENLYENLLPGGYICLGHAESMSRISPLFEVRRFDDAIVYRRPLEGPDA
jgi:chemotaxis protein methyltransferase CheR